MFRIFIRCAVLVVIAMPAASVAAQTAVSPELVTACVQSQQQTMTAVDAANRRIELARQTNQPAAMRAAMDDLQLALSSMRTQLAPCATLQAAAAPAAHNMANMPAATPAVTAGATAPAAAAPSADPHGGHVMPAAPQAPAAAPTTGSRAPATQARPAPAPAADPHGGHVMPAAAPSSSAAPHARGAAAQPRAAAAAATKAPAAEPGPGMANMPGHNMAKMTTGASSPALAVDLPTGPEKLACNTKVDPKTAPRAAYAGKTYYFCSVPERDRFVKAPAAYLPKQ